MFRKNTSINIEFLKDGRLLIETNINKNTKAEKFADFLNNLLLRQNYLEEILESVLRSSDTNNCPEKGKEIYSLIMEVQKNFEVKPVNYNRRKPLVNPLEVMNKLSESPNE